MAYFIDELQPGMSASTSKTVTEADIILFAGISTDVNPAHLDEEYAKTTRFGERIAHGIFTAGFVSTVIGMYLPGPGTIYLSQTLAFKAPEKIGDVVTVNVEVVEKIEKGHRLRMKCEALVDGKAVLEGEAVVMAPTRAA